MVIVITVIVIIMFNASVSVTGPALLQCSDYLGQHGHVYRTTSYARAVAIVNDLAYVVQRFHSR